MSLIAWYKLDGNALDSSGNNRNLTTNTATPTTAGKIGGCYTFASGNAISTTSGIDLPHNVSFTAWAYNNNAFAGNLMIFSCNSTLYSGPDLYFTGTIAWNTGDGAANPFKKNGVNVVYPSSNAWHHYAVVNNQELNKTLLYIDGEYYGEATYRNTFQENRGFTIGNYFPGSTGYAWAGMIDDVRIYNHLLTEKEIKELAKAKILHYTFDEFQEPTENLIPNSPVNTYPTVGNAHGTYNVNQYNNNTYFSIGTIASVSNNIVTLATVDRAIYTYDVLNPQTTGGGVTAGTHYFIKKHSANSFSLHAYNNSQDGSQGFAVHNSIHTDTRIAINGTNFPTMWKGNAHMPNSSLVKEIITNGFNFEGRVHDCIRCHGEHAIPNNGQDYMAYGVSAQVVAGETYTFSCMVRAATPESIGANINLTLWTSGDWALSGSSVTFTDMNWVKMVKTGVAPNSGGVSMYFPFSKGKTIDIAEIQCEKKDHATEFTTSSRTGSVTDNSGYDNHGIIDVDRTPQWSNISKLGNGSYYFSNFPKRIYTSMIMPTDTITMSFWFKGTSNGKGSYHEPLNSDSLLYEISIGNSGDLRGGLYLNGSRVVANYGSGCLDGNWHMLSMTYDGTVKRHYIDGNLVGELLTKGAMSGGTRTISIGVYGLGETYANVNSYEDDVRIYATALSADDVKELYNTRAQIDDKGNVYSNQIEQPSNLAGLINNAINNKVFADGLSSYTQSNCQVSLTNDGYRTYRPPNLTVATNGNTMWGGFTIYPPEECKQIGRTYKIRFDMKGQTTNAFDTYIANSVGWSTLGIGLIGQGSLNITNVANFQSSVYTPIEATYTVSTTRFSNGIWPCDITSGSTTIYYNSALHSSATRMISGDYLLPNPYFPTGTKIMSAYTDRVVVSFPATASGTNILLKTNRIYDNYSQIKIGFTYASTGTLGTDLYFKNFSIIDITGKTTSEVIYSNGTLWKEEISELGPTNGLVAYYPLNGDAKDYANANDGTVNGAVIAGGINGKACYSFDGVDDYINCGDFIDYSNGFTLSSWINPDTYGTSNYGRIVDKTINTGTSTGFFLYMPTAPTLQFMVNNTGGITASANSTPYGSWTHIIAQVDSSGNCKIYINGVLNVSGTTGAPSGITATTPLTIGNRSGATDRAFDGLIQNVRIYNRALSPEEISILYDLEKGDTIKVKMDKNTLYVGREIYETL